MVVIARLDFVLHWITSSTEASKIDEGNGTEA
jgi:hypothetical protein